MSTVIITISKRSYTTRNRALGVAKQAISREMNVLANPSGDPLFWTLDNVVVEETADGWRWHVEIDMPSTEDIMAEVEAQERLDMEDETYFERIASESKEEAQEEVPRELTVEQALETAAQQTEAVDEEFRAVEARRKAEAEQKLARVKDATGMELSLAASEGKRNLAETISRMETALKHLKEFQSEYKEAAKDSEENAFYMAERLRRASNEIHGYICTSLALELATTAGSLEQLAKIACRLDIDGE